MLSLQEAVGFKRLNGSITMGTERMYPSLSQTSQMRKPMFPTEKSDPSSEQLDDASHIFFLLQFNLFLLSLVTYNEHCVHMYTQGARAFSHSSSYLWSFCLLLCVEKSKISFQSYELVCCSHAHQEQQKVVTIIVNCIIGGYSIKSYLAGVFLLFCWLVILFYSTYMTVI